MNPVADADRHVYLLVHNRLRARWLDPIMIWATKAGTKGTVWTGIAAGLLINDRVHSRWVALLMLVALLVAQGTINLVLKPLFRRARPYETPGLARLLVAAPGPHSWPSAHAGSSFASAVVLAIAYPLWAPAALLLALLVAYSRIYVGVHYPLDVLAGIIIGSLAAGAVLLLSNLITPLLPFPTGF
ncbi:MAG TPA: phosphatase PAP2 family protein [Chloroflexota bacterium]|nr:phosphatase PAP2 family protein [Chloroflexota bacterium]